jgi:hypothetical protein
MIKKDIQQLIAKLLDEGHSLSDIQTILSKDYDEKMTFMDLRIMASEIESIDWTKDEEPDDETGKDDKESEVQESEGKTVVEISKLQRPGIALSGSVKFISGASGEWVLDQRGGLGFEKTDGEPTEEDLQEFQKELQRTLGGG